MGDSLKSSECVQRRETLQPLCSSRKEDLFICQPQHTQKRTKRRHIQLLCASARRTREHEFSDVIVSETARRRGYNTRHAQRVQPSWTSLWLSVQRVLYCYVTGTRNDGSKWSCWSVLDVHDVHAPDVLRTSRRCHGVNRAVSDDASHLIGW